MDYTTIRVDMDKEKALEKPSPKSEEILAVLRQNLHPSKEVEQEVKQQLVPLFADFYPSSAKFLMYKKYRLAFSERISKANQFNNYIVGLTEIIGPISSTDTKDKRKSKVLLGALLYLSEVELLGNILVDEAILLLVAGGADLHLEPDYEHRYVRHVNSLEDLQSPSLSLSVKLDFLDSNGLGCFSKWINRPLRNKIAHLDFDIDEEGHFKLGKKTINLGQQMKCFEEYFKAISMIFAEEDVKAFTS